MSVYPIFIIFIIKLDANFFNLAKISVFFRFYLFFKFYSSAKYIDKSEIRSIKSKKYTDFSRKSGKLAVRIKDDYYINWKNAQSGKVLIIFPEIWTEKAVDGLPNAELKVKLITGKPWSQFHSTTLALQARVSCLFFGVFINLLHNSTLALTLFNHGLI